MVQRAHVLDGRMGATPLIVQALDAYRAGKGRHDEDSTVGEWLGLHRTTIYRARQALGSWFGPIRRQFSKDGNEAWLKVMLAEVRELGAIAALVLAELRSWERLGSGKRWGRGFLVEARRMGRFVGCCAKTALSALRRLETRFIEVLRTRGAPWAVRLLGEREQGLPKPKLRPVPPALLEARRQTEAQAQAAERYRATIEARLSEAERRLCGPPDPLAGCFDALEKATAHLD